MTKEDLRACRDELVGFHKRFSPCFGRIECQGHAFHYLQGLLLAPKRKCVEPMALRFADGSVVPMQRFLTRGVWDAANVQRKVQAVAAERLAPSAIGTPEGAALVIDESAFAKKGTHADSAESECLGEPTTQWTSGQGGQLPGRCLPGVRDPGGHRPRGPSVVPAEGVGP